MPIFQRPLSQMQDRNTRIGVGNIGRLSGAAIACGAVLGALMVFGHPQQATAQQWDPKGTKEEKCAVLSAWLDHIEAEASEVFTYQVTNEQRINAAAFAYKSPTFDKFFGQPLLDFSVNEWTSMGRLFSTCRDRRYGYDVGIPFMMPHRLSLSGPWYEAIFGPDYATLIKEAETARNKEKQQAAQVARRQAATRGQAGGGGSSSYNPYPDIPSCGVDDIDCTVKARCQRFVGSDEYSSCLGTHLRREIKVRQKTLAASFDVKGEAVRLYLGRHPWAGGKPGAWCGPDLWGRIEYPQELNVIPALAKTTIEFLNATLSSRCPEARRVQVALARYSNKYSNGNALSRDTSLPVDYLDVFRDGDIWQFTFHEKYLADQQAMERLRAFWSMVSNPTQLGYVQGTIIANEAAAKSSQARLAKYAREGKVCEMPENARHCYISTTWTTGYGGTIGKTTLISHTPQRHSSCPEPCKNAQGYCDMNTGVVYGDAEAAERSNCRAASQAEIDAAIARVQPSAQIKTYPIETLYIPWHELPHDWRTGLNF